MLITTNPQPTLWETILPPGYQGLPRELAAVDALLDDPVFFEPYRAHFNEEFGRPSIPIETYLRMMFLKHRYGLGYETLSREVAYSLSRFCRVSLGTRVPHPSTLGKITTRCGAETIAALNEALLVKAAGVKVVRTDKVRADTTVVAANVAFPTDSGLLTRAISMIVALVGVIHAAGGASRTKVRDRRRAAGRRARSISAHLKLRNDEAKARVLTITGELADLAELTSTEAQKVLVNARRCLAPSGRGRVGAAALGGRQRRRDRARPQPAPGQPGRRAAARPGYWARPDRAWPGGAGGDRGPRLRRGQDRPRADRSRCAHRGHPSQGQAEPGAPRGRARPRGFRRLVKWRTGCEGRISYLKRRYGFDRTLFDTLAGAQTWCGLGVLAHNTVKIATLLQACPPRPAASPRRRPARPARPAPSPAPDTAGTGPHPIYCSTTPPPDTPPGRSSTSGRRLPQPGPPESGPQRPTERTNRSQTGLVSTRPRAPSPSDRPTRSLFRGEVASEASLGPPRCVVAS